VARFGIEERLKELERNLSEMADARSRGESEVELSSVRFVTPLNILPIKSYANHYGLAVNCTQDPDSDACRYLETIGFQSGATDLRISKKSNYLPIMNLLAVEEDQTLTDYENRIFSQANLPEAYGLHDSIDLLTGELVNNVRQHAGIKNYWIFAQYYKQSTNKMCEIVVADNGVGYKKSYENTKFRVETDAEAIQNALAGKSSKLPKYGDLDGRGFGIPHLVNLFINGFHGKLVFISGKSMLYYKESRTAPSKDFELPFEWPGSAVCINFNVKDVNAMDYVVY